MTSALDTDPNKLNANIAAKLKKIGLVVPKFAGLVKSGAHAERPPEQPDFFYIRCASILRHLYGRSTIGVQQLRVHYGGKKKRGVRPEKYVRSGGSLIRKAFQALEKIGLVEKIEKGKKPGRVLSPQGRKIIDNSAKEINKLIV